MAGEDELRCGNGMFVWEGSREEVAVGGTCRSKNHKYCPQLGQKLDWTGARK